MGFSPGLTSRRHPLLYLRPERRLGAAVCGDVDEVLRLQNCSVSEQPEEAPSGGQALGRAGVWALGRAPTAPLHSCTRCFRRHIYEVGDQNVFHSAAL